MASRARGTTHTPSPRLPSRCAAARFPSRCIAAWAIYAELDVLIARKHQRTFMIARPEERLLADVTLQRWVGLTSTQIVRLARKAQEGPARLHKAHGGVEWVSGFPGETLCMCRCGMII